MTNDQYIKDLENFITDELLPAYIENCSRLGKNPNQSYIVKKLLKIMKTKEQVPALFKPKMVVIAKKKSN